MAKKTITTCDICGDDISREYQYIFRGWHYRLGKHHKYYMCQKCLNLLKKDAAKLIKEKEGK